MKKKILITGDTGFIGSHVLNELVSNQFQVIALRRSNMSVTKIKIEGVQITHQVDQHAGVLLVALFIWVLAHIFMTGLKLQEEKDLTI